MNILIIIESSGIGGLEVHTASLASSLKSMGCGVRVIIFTCDFVNDEMRSTIAAFFDGKGIDSVAMPKCDIWKGAAYLADIIEEQNIDILHSHTAYTAEICDLLARRYKKAYVQTIHGKYPFDPAGDPCRYAGHIIFISEELKDYHAGELLKEERPASVIPNGVEITRPVSGSINRADAYDEKNLSFADTSAAKERIKANDFNKNGIEPFILVFASRIDPDYIESIERFAAGVVEAYKADRRIRAEIYGAGSEGEAVKEIIERSNASAGREILLFKGFSDRIMERFAEGDVVIGVGRIILEAMAVGRPALVLGRWGYGSYINEGNADELVKFNFTGRDVQKAYDPVEFAADICFLANDRDTYSRLSEFGRNFVMEGYSQASVTSRTFEIYKSILGNPLPDAAFSEVAACEAGPDYEVELKEYVIFLAPDFLDPESRWEKALRLLDSGFKADDPVTVVILLYPSCGLTYGAAINQICGVISEQDESMDLLVLTDLIDEVMISNFLKRVDSYIHLDSPFDDYYSKKAFMCGCRLLWHHDLKQRIPSPDQGR